MRNLTITRRKSFIGCAAKDQVYIRDEQAPELVIEGVPCRKLGDLKNGEQKTFLIGEAQQQIFIISDKLSKDYCNASVTIPEGQEDVSYSGKHHFVLGTNPFRFDGVPISGAQLARQKQKGRKGLVIMIAAVTLGGVLGGILPGLFLNKEAAPKDFSAGNFRITLTEDFSRTYEEGFYAFFQEKTAMVFVLRESKENFGQVTLEEYAELVLQANGRTDLTVHKDNGLIWFAYTETPAQQEIYYMAFCYESGDAFWLVNFATPSANQKQYEDRFLRWAETVTVTGAE